MYADLALTKQAFETLMALCPPENIQMWQPSVEQRAKYLGLADRVLDGVMDLEGIERRRLLSEGTVSSTIPPALLEFLRDGVMPRVATIRAAIEHLDPGANERRELLAGFFYDAGPRGAGGALRATFDVGIEQVCSLLDRNPDFVYGEDHFLLPERAAEILDSKLIQFEPDAWLDRVGNISPVRTSRNGDALPGHVRLRLEELYRAYVFGLWLSVLALSRAILEYSLLDNLFKFKIEPVWPPDRDGRRRGKRLSHLIDEVAEYLPNLKQPMTLLRDYGNEYLHPKSSQPSKESLLRRQMSAKDVVAELVAVVEALYHAKRVP
jgi:hypothetical protein